MIVKRLRVQRVSALGKVADDLVVVSHTLPPSTGVDGVLGLDFLRGGCLTVDLRKGTVALD